MVISGCQFSAVPSKSQLTGNLTRLISEPQLLPINSFLPFFLLSYFVRSHFDIGTSLYTSTLMHLHIQDLP